MNSILFTPEEVREADTPFSYFHSKIDELHFLQNRVAQEAQKAQLNAGNETGIGLRGLNSAQLGYLMAQYQHKHVQFQQTVKEQQRYLNPDQFESIFQDASQAQEEEEQSEAVRDYYYQEFILKPQLQQQEQERKKVALYSVVEAKKQEPETVALIKFKTKVMEDLRKEVHELSSQNEHVRKRAEVSVTCKNVNLIRKLAPTIYNAINIHFDEIFDAFIEELLTEEAAFLNRLEEQEQNGYFPNDYANQSPQQVRRSMVLAQQSSPEKGLSQSQYAPPHAATQPKRGSMQKSPTKKVRDLVADQEININMLKLINTLDEYGDEDDMYSQLPQQQQQKDYLMNNALTRKQK